MPGSLLASLLRPRGEAMPRIVVLGDLVTDVVVSVREEIAPGSDASSSITTAGGGSGANVAAWLADSGADVVFVGAVGADPEGVMRVDELHELGVAVQVRRVSGAQTGTVVVIVTPDGQRTMLPDRGANLH